MDEGAGQFLQIEIIQQEIRAWHGKNYPQKKKKLLLLFWFPHKKKKRFVSSLFRDKKVKKKKKKGVEGVSFGLYAKCC